MLKRLNQKGAMFGLDTRLTLAIMAAMTLVVGYYSIARIQDAKEGALLKELTNYEDAFLAYQADMGTFIMFTLNGGSDGTRDVEALWDQSEVATGFQNRWGGPYYKYRDYTSDHLTYGDFTMTYGQADANMSACTSSTDCHAWLTLTDVPLNVWLSINSIVDESLGSNTEASPEDEGKVRADSIASSPVTLFYRVLERPNN